MTTAQTLKTIRKCIKDMQFDCKVARVGTGKNFDIALWGPHSGPIVDMLCAKWGFAVTPMSGTGTRINPITITK
jgi:hypothetical protein